jgi:hypothetical protein
MSTPKEIRQFLFSIIDSILEQLKSRGYSEYTLHSHTDRHFHTQTRDSTASYIFTAIEAVEYFHSLLRLPNCFNFDIHKDDEHEIVYTIEYKNCDLYYMVFGWINSDLNSGYSPIRSFTNKLAVRINRRKEIHWHPISSNEMVTFENDEDYATFIQNHFARNDRYAPDDQLRDDLLKSQKDILNSPNDYQYYYDEFKSQLKQQT